MEVKIERFVQDFANAELHCTTAVNAQLQRFPLRECTGMVDGIGGTTWDGSLILYECLSDVLKCNLKDNIHTNLIELGCGAGLCGLLCACHAETSVLLTDQEVDLCMENISLFNATAVATGVNGRKPTPVAEELSWEADNDTQSRRDLLSALLSRIPDRSKLPSESDQGCAAQGEASALSGVSAEEETLIVGAEITVLYKQQPKLVSTIHALFQSRSPTIPTLGSNNQRVFLSFDDLPPPLNTNKFETTFDELMLSIGMNKLVVASGCVLWEESELDSPLHLPQNGAETSSTAEVAGHRRFVARTSVVPHCTQGQVRNPHAAATGESASDGESMSGRVGDVFDLAAVYESAPIKDDVNDSLMQLLVHKLDSPLVRAAFAGCDDNVKSERTGKSIVDRFVKDRTCTLHHVNMYYR